MGFQTPQYKLADYLKWTVSGRVQLPDFQRGYKWEDERIRQLLITILRGHPLGVMMLLKTGNDQIRFKPRAVEGVQLAPGTEAELLLLDGQQRLTSLTQSLTGEGVVATKDSRGKLMERRYYVHIATSLLGEDRVEEAVISVPGDGVVRTNFGKDVVLDLSDEDKEREAGYFPFRLLFDPLAAATWLTKLTDTSVMPQFIAGVMQAASSYEIPAIELDKETTKAAVATVFEKVNTGGLPLNVFELLTATFAGDKAYFEKTGADFRLNEDWTEIKQELAKSSVLSKVQSTDFLQAITILTTRKKAATYTGSTPPAVSAKREDILRLDLADYLEWRDEVLKAFNWVATFLADRHIFDVKFLPYATQLVPLAVLKVVLGGEAELQGVKARLVQWFWSGILGELYGSAVETQFVRDVEQVPPWATNKTDQRPKTIADASFRASRLLSLRTRNAAAYKGLYALILGHGARDWMNDQELSKVQYSTLAVDIHHVFPYRWCVDNKIDVARRESIVNKTPLSAVTNRTIGGVAPAKYLAAVETKAQIDEDTLADSLRTHLLDPEAMRANDFDAHFAARTDLLLKAVEEAMGKPVLNDLESAEPETFDDFDPEDEAVKPDLEDIEELAVDDTIASEDSIVHGEAES